MLIKLGEAISIEAEDVISADAIEAENPEMLSRFKKLAENLKIIAPKAKDFLYFTAVMMHAAERALIDDHGNLKTGSDGTPISAEWVKNGDSWSWKCSDPKIVPYKNNNCDIFPESELILAHKDWVGKPLCLDHKSTSVDFVRGIIVDTFYDKKLKRVVSLCALDKVNYPDLARKVSSGYSASVSMGTAVEKAICSDCGTVAKVEADFCDHMRNKTCYGEINVGLKPMELSIVVNGADPLAKIRHIVASAESVAKYVDSKEKFVAEANKLTQKEADELINDLSTLDKEVSKLQDNIDDSSPAYGVTGRGAKTMPETDLPNTDFSISAPVGKYAGSALELLTIIHDKIDNLKLQINKIASNKRYEEKQMSDKKAYWLGGGGVNEPAPKEVKYPKEDYETIRDTQDKQMVGKGMESGTDGLHPGYGDESEENLKKRMLRASEEEKRAERRKLAVENAKRILKNKKAYHLGGGGLNDPENLPYPKEDYEKIRDTEDKQMTGPAPFPGVGDVEGLYGDDLEKKKKLLRAKLNAKFIKAAKADGSQDLARSYWQVFADDKEVMKVYAGEVAGSKVDVLYDTIATKDFGRKILATIRNDGFQKAAALFKAAQEPLDLPPQAVEKGPSAPPSEAMPSNTEITRMTQLRAAGDYSTPSWWTYPDLDVTANGDVVNKASGAVVLKKKAQAALPAAAGPAAAPGLPPDASGAMAPMADMPGDAEAPVEEEDSGAGEDLDSLGEPLDVMGAKIQEMDNQVQELSEAYEALKEHQAPKTEVMPKAANATMSLNTMSKILNGALRKGIKETKASLQDSVEELKLISYAYNSNGVNKKNASFLNDLAVEALKDADNTIVEANKILQSFVKYAHGTEALAKRAAKKERLAKKAQELPKAPLRMPELKVSPDAGAPSSSEAGSPENYEETLDSLVKEKKPSLPPPAAQKGQPLPVQPPPAEQLADDLDVACASEFKLPDGTEVKTDETLVPDGFKAASDNFDLTTKEGRAKMRAKRAKEALQYSDMLSAAHPDGGHDVSVDASDDLARVEDLVETQKKMMDVATAPPNVRKHAAEIQALVKAGNINPATDFPTLIAEGLDPEAVKYWKELYGEAKDPAATEFAAELTKQHEEEKRAAEMEQFRVKTARAYELAYKMASKNMIASTHEAVAEQAASIVNWNDEHFENMNRILDRQESIKTASMPQVGIISGDDTRRADKPAADIKDLFAAAFAGRKY